MVAPEFISLADKNLAPTFLVAGWTTMRATVQRMRRSYYGEKLEPGLIQPVIDAAAKYGVIVKPLSVAVWRGTVCGKKSVCEV
jgi:hypothetical protein